MMGTGKTTTGALVAEGLSVPFHDLDTEIMLDTGRTIPELFGSGEEAFRDAESTVLTRLADEPASVISTGGGAILRATNVETMRRTGAIVLLTAKVETLADRIGEDEERPLSDGPTSLRDLATARSAAYRNAADFIVSTDDKSPDAVAREVMTCSAM